MHGTARNTWFGSKWLGRGWLGMSAGIIAGLAGWHALAGTQAPDPQWALETALMSAVNARGMRNPSA